MRMRLIGDYCCYHVTLRGSDHIYYKSDIRSNWANIGPIPMPWIGARKRCQQVFHAFYNYFLFFPQTVNSSYSAKRHQNRGQRQREAQPACSQYTNHPGPHSSNNTQDSPEYTNVTYFASRIKVACGDDVMMSVIIHVMCVCVCVCVEGLLSQRCSLHI